MLIFSWSKSSLPPARRASTLTSSVRIHTKNHVFPQSFSRFEHRINITPLKSFQSPRKPILAMVILLKKHRKCPPKSHFNYSPKLKIFHLPTKRDIQASTIMFLPRGVVPATFPKPPTKGDRVVVPKVHQFSLANPASSSADFKAHVLLKNHRN